MSDIPQNLTKLYYSIGEVADMLDLNNSLLRYWEGEFSELKPRKNRKGDRQFTVKDIETVYLIHELVKERGFTIEGARKEIKEQQQRRKKILPIEKKLKSIKKSLVKMRNQL
ncbi:MerR family transcriptional regulator [Saprospiraceae bacterium]|nr:MerR family transcriptional regulator [Saprospiraceae bacterium]